MRAISPAFRTPLKSCRRYRSFLPSLESDDEEAKEGPVD